MARLPWFPFFPSDWFRDTRCLSLAARGAWIDVIGILWDSPTRGKKSHDMDGWASELGKPLAEVESAFMELEKRAVCIVKRSSNGLVTLLSRRMNREEKVREQGRKRVQRLRRNANVTQSVTPDVTQVKRSCNALESEVRSQKSESDKEKKKRMPQRADIAVGDDWLETLKTNPAYLHINWTVEWGKMDAWFSKPGNAHRKRTQTFILNWLNKIEVPMTNGHGGQRPPPPPPKNDPIGRGQWKQQYGKPEDHGYV